MQQDYIKSRIMDELNKKKFKFAVKRTFDIIFALLLLILLNPLFIFIIVWIKLDSEGEVIFKQTRIGINNKDFVIFKFRTMIKNADKMYIKKIEQENLKNFVFQDKDDARITKSGKFLRKTSLDELPQLLNIVKGEMSLIGPRPEIPDIVRLYSDYDSIRLLVKPGVTGLAQVNGRGNLELGETIAYDVEYVNKFSLFLDLKIFIKTFKAVFTREGAY